MFIQLGGTLSGLLYVSVLKTHLLLIFLISGEQYNYKAHNYVKISWTIIQLVVVNTDIILAVWVNYCIIKTNISLHNGYCYRQQERTQGRIW